MIFSALSVALVWVASLSPSPLLVTGPNGAAQTPQVADLGSLRAQFPQARITLGADGRSPRTIVGIRIATMGESPRAQAEDFLSRFGQITGATSFRYSGESASRDLTTVRFEQLHDGFPVLDRNVVIRLDKAGFVRGLVSDVSKIRQVSESRMTVEQAKTLAQKAAGVSNMEPISSRGWAVVGTEGTPIIEVELSRVPLSDP